MSFQLSDSHITLTSSDAVKDICKPLKSHLGITTFSYVKINPDLSRIHLDTNCEWIEFFYKNFERYYKDSLTEASHCQSGLQILHNLEDNACIRDSLDFNIGNGIVISTHEKNETELVYFALNHDKNDSALLNLISNQDLLYKFIPYFREQANPLLAKAKKSLIKLPFLNSETSIKSLNKINLTRKIFLSDIGLKKSPQISPQESEVLRYTANDLTAKEVAQRMGISYRTVEKYIYNLKFKLNCKTKAGLIRFYDYLHTAGNSDT